MKVQLPKCYCTLIMQLKTAGSNILFAAVTEISDSVLKGAETSGFNGMVRSVFLGLEMYISEIIS